LIAKDAVTTSANRVDIDEHIDAVNSFGNKELWELGRYINENLFPSRHNGRNGDKILESIASHPKARHPYAFLKQCALLYSIYPDLSSRPLPENFYFDLATRVFDETLRDHYEQLAIEDNFNITQLRKAIRDGVLERREKRRNELGFDLKITNWWYFNSADPRFGKSNFKGRVAGQIIANALYFYTSLGDVVLDPFEGSGTLGDVIDKLEYFRSLKYKMYDLKPSDPRIAKNDVLSGLPEKSKSVNYIFLDPPYGSIPRGYYTKEPEDFSQMSSDAFISGIKGLIRECWRVLKTNGKVSIVIEPYVTASSFYDLPTAIGAEFKSIGFIQISKVYLPNQTMRRGGMMPHIIETAKQKRFMLSDCREMLTFQKKDKS